jgi:farnesyl diphosphate synthase
MMRSPWMTAMPDSAPMDMAFAQWITATQSAVERELETLLPSASHIPQRLHAAMRYAVLGGGKRVRPLLVFAAGELVGAPPARLARAAAAVEMMHAYSLVHDDMPCMDNDVLRRGKPTVHVQFDEATALLVGDALQTLAFEVLASAAGDAASTLAMVQRLSRASGSMGMAGGQAIDLASVGATLEAAQLEQMHRAKTGALLAASVMLGALSGGPLNPYTAGALESYASAIGLAFQVVDDLLDVETDTATLGKTAGKDALQDKPTYVSTLGLAASRELAERLRHESHEALKPLGAKSARLAELADLIVLRKS